MVAPDDIERRMIAAADALNERVRTCHERVACPKCSSPVGARCCRVGSRSANVLKHPHAERLRADGIYLR